MRKLWNMSFILFLIMIAGCNTGSSSLSSEVSNNEGTVESSVEMSVVLESSDEESVAQSPNQMDDHIYWGFLDTYNYHYKVIEDYIETSVTSGIYNEDYRAASMLRGIVGDVQFCIFPNDWNMKEITRGYYIVRYFGGELTRIFLVEHPYYQDETLKVIPTGLIGFSRYFEVKYLNISQGEFLAAYCVNSHGNGGIDLISLDDPGTIKYSFGAARREQSDFPADPSRFADVPNLYLKDGLAVYYMLYHDKLVADYIDSNGDGHTDVELRGVIQTFVKIAEDEYTLYEEYYIRDVYVYNPRTDSFDFSPEYSRYQKVAEVGSYIEDSRWD